jgi:hypothetical protein
MLNVIVEGVVLISPSSLPLAEADTIRYKPPLLRVRRSEYEGRGVEETKRRLQTYLEWLTNQVSARKRKSKDR